ncbi:capsule biosynthesis protein capA [Campylobacter sp. MIT 99-7217]|uniref:CapA family protein n=1 Tax=Campylobacter sp. MIT 99-7217 TaxID=535091 RepID=UPI001158B769|nr:CapA family protein [Campylobacter sp. MIT 99-7217]TQR31891.1 capsule biosynthesis protein capA [Campylobacter sp. MIT 99-7217]
MKRAFDFCLRFLLFLNLFYFSHADQTHVNSNLSSQQDIFELSLIMTGDALLHSRVYKDAKISKDGRVSYDFSPMLRFLKPLIKEHDLAFYNQESVLGGKELGLSTYPNFNSPQEFGLNMLELGFNLVSLANNHSFDRKEEALLSSLRFWQKTNAVFAGVNKNLRESRKNKIYTKNGIKYAFLAYTYGLNSYELPKEQAFLINIYSKERLKQDIQALRSEVDLLIVSMHWGKEYVFTPTKEQKDLAFFLAEQGVDIVIGTHPHVLQPIEMINDTLVVYSLGNFLSSQIGLERRIGALVSLKITKKPQEKIKMSDLKAELTYVHYDEDGDKFTNFIVYPFSLLNEEILPHHQEIKDQYLRILFKDFQEEKSGLE